MRAADSQLHPCDPVVLENVLETATHVSTTGLAFVHYYCGYAPLRNMA